MSDSLFSEPDVFTAALITKLQGHLKRIVFTEGEDIRVIRVAERLVAMQVAVPILLGNIDRIRALAKSENISMEFVGVIDPKEAYDLDKFVERYERVEKYRGRVIANAREVVARTQVYGGLMVQYGHADALVGGNQMSSGSFYRGMLRSIKRLPEVESLFTVMVLVEHPGLQNFGREGFLFLSDCGLIPQPTTSELACVAVETGKLAAHYFGRRPRVAMLSHSTHGSNVNPASRAVQAALEVARQHASVDEMDLDGELQADVALDPAAAELKLKDEAVDRRADALIFPSLDAAHIAMKLLVHVAGAQCYGHLVMGLARPVAQVPVTASERMIFGTACAVGVEAVKFHELYPQGRGLAWA